jgi:hypothetical protein
MRSDELTADR